MGESETRIFFFMITVVMLLLALFLPFAYRMDIGPGPDSIRAMFWDYIESSWYSGFRIWNPLDTLPYTILRLVFALMIARVFVGKTTALRAILVGILAELQSFLVSAPLVYLISWPGDGDPWVPLYIPLPVLLVLGVIVLAFIMRRQTTG